MNILKLKKVFLNNINLTINKNDTVAITGDSGSGKTTLINIIIGFINPTKGSIEVDNKNIRKILVGGNRILVMCLRKFIY